MTIRSHEAGDLGWVLLRHGEFYRQAYRFDPRFEALVSRLLTDFAERHDPERERLWIAVDESGRRVGSIMLAAEPEDEADGNRPTCRLRLFFVEPDARGGGVGTRLMTTLLDFARDRDYARIVLSTVDALAAARHLYRRAGFEVRDRFDHADWNVPVTEETWQLDLP